MDKAVRVVGVVFAVVFRAASAEPTIYKCVGQDGVPVYQNSPCPSQLSPEAKAKKRQESVARKCTRNPLNPSLYYRCVAEVSCDDEGVFGSSRYQCISVASQEMERLEAQESQAKASNASRYQSTVPRQTEDEKTAEAMRVARNLRYKPTESESRYVPKEEPVDCLNLALYAEALGDNLFERAAMLQTAVSRGLCKRNPP